MKAYRNFGLWLLTIALLVAVVAGCSKSKSDAQVASEVQSKIQSDAAVTNKQMGVNVANGVVTLNGQVQNDMERSAAANDAAQVEGVKTVVNNLQVNPEAAGMLNQPDQQQQMNEPAASAPRSSRRSPSTPRASEKYNPTPQQSASNNLPSMNNPPAAAPMPPPPPPPVEVDAGTTLSVRMLDSIDSDRNQAGDTFRATLDQPIVVDGKTVIPANADVQGRVVDLASAGHFKGKSQLALELTRVSYSGHSYSIQTNQWSKEGGSRGVRTAETVGGGAALGAIIGGIAGGGKGAAIGAAVGAGAGTGVQAATKGQQIHVPPETVLNFRLEQPVTVAAASRNRTPNQMSDQDNPDYNNPDANDPNRPVLKRR
jgi:hypothetical protein